MKDIKKLLFKSALLLPILMLMVSFRVFASEGEYLPSMYATFWALVPPVIAIGLALLTKEVYSSLFAGILIGGIFYSGFSFEGTISHVFENGFIAVLSDSYNVGILIFLVILGAIVSLMNAAGGSAAFGRFAREKIKTRTGAQLTTLALGILIFIDDYFNCLTVGSVMRPVTDGHQISRSKLAYLIDATAAPICIIAPISSWAAAVSGLVEGEDGFTIFIRAIPYNFYALLTFVMMIGIILLNFDFGSMKKHEENAANGDLFSEKESDTKQQEELWMNPNGTIWDLILPILVLIAACIIGMLYTGGFFSGENFVTAFSNSNASVGLSLGSACALILIIVFYQFRKALSFQDCMACLPTGFKTMVPAMLILTFAWTLKTMTDSLGAAVFVEELMKQSAGAFMNFLPAIIFVVGCLLAFSTGTSWGTFGILIPIVVAAFSETNPQMMIISISACMAGAVCGDHCSPISDTTIMASAGAQCNHVNHVTTQLPYIIVVASVSFVTYIVAGFTQSAWISLPIGIALLFITLIILKRTTSFNQKT